MPFGSVKSPSLVSKSRGKSKLKFNLLDLVLPVHIGPNHAAPMLLNYIIQFGAIYTAKNKPVYKTVGKTVINCVIKYSLTQ